MWSLIFLVLFGSGLVYHDLFKHFGKLSTKWIPPIVVTGAPLAGAWLTWPEYAHLFVFIHIQFWNAIIFPSDFRSCWYGYGPPWSLRMYKPLRLLGLSYLILGLCIVHNPQSQNRSNEMFILCIAFFADCVWTISRIYNGVVAELKIVCFLALLTVVAEPFRRWPEPARVCLAFGVILFAIACALIKTRYRNWLGVAGCLVFVAAVSINVSYDRADEDLKYIVIILSSAVATIVLIIHALASYDWTLLIPHRHVYLQDSARQVRLLECVDARPDRFFPQSFKLVTRSTRELRDMHDRHYALSYTWNKDGDYVPDKLNTYHRQVILVDGRAMGVQDNLWEFLQSEAATPYLKPGTLIYIDALCINQKDAAEKAHQVHLMKEVYYHAKCVIRQTLLEAALDRAGILTGWEDCLDLPKLQRVSRSFLGGVA